MSDWREAARARLPGELNAQGDLVPPWAKYPTYERYTIGWRMGGGESWLGYWHLFREALPRDEATRLAYLRRHPPAPICWADHVWHTLYPDEPEPEELEDEDAEEARAEAMESTLEMDMGYVDAWRLWGMCFDDREQMERFTHFASAPPEWRGFIEQQMWH